MKRMFGIGVLVLLLAACAAHYRVPKPADMPNPTIWGPVYTPPVTP